MEKYIFVWLMLLILGVLLYFILNWIAGMIVPEMKLQIISGTVKSIRAISKRVVHIELDNYPKVVELYCTDAWVLNKHDNVVLAGFDNETSGMFTSVYYKNKTKSVTDSYKPSLIPGYILATIGILLSWFILPPIIGLYFARKSHEKCKAYTEAINTIKNY